MMLVRFNMHYDIIVYIGVIVDSVIMPTSYECICCCEIERVIMKEKC